MSAANVRNSHFDKKESFSATRFESRVSATAPGTAGATATQVRDSETRAAWRDSPYLFGRASGRIASFARRREALLPADRGGDVMPRTWIVLVVICLMFSTSAAAQPASDGTEAGRTVFFSQGCYGCHRLGVAGTPIAHDLSRVGRKYTEAELEKWLRDPTSQKPTAHMPRLALTDDEIRTLARYLSSLR